jgi:hypothetical protein
MRIENLSKLKQALHACLDNWTEFVETTVCYHQSYPDPFIRINKRLRSIEDKIEDIVCAADELVNHIEEDNLKRTQVRGAPAKPINTLFLVWSYFMHGKRSVHVQTIIDFIKWLHERTLYLEKEKIEDQNFYKLIYRYRTGKLKASENWVQRYVFRFYFLMTNICLLQRFKNRPNVPLITFSNKQSLKISTCYNHKVCSRTSGSKEYRNLGYPPFDLDFARKDAEETYFLHRAALDYIDQLFAGFAQENSQLVCPIPKS